MDKGNCEDKREAKAFPDSSMPGNTGQSGAALAEAQAKLEEPGLVADSQEPPIQATPKKRKDDLEVTIAPGLSSTSDIALGPPH